VRNLRKFGKILVILSLTSLLFFGCRSSTEPFTDTVATPTPTEITGVLLQPDEAINRCDGLTGSLEIQILVGPSEVVGMEPVAVGDIPFSVVAHEGDYFIEGSGSVNFDDQVFEADWGTYTVSFSADNEISGRCEPLDQGAILHMNVTMDGEQMVTVITEGFQMDYPWSGRQEITTSFPAEEGATQSGEGWRLVLYLAP